MLQDLAKFRHKICHNWQTCHL